MLRRTVQYLLAPTETDGGGTALATADAGGSAPDYLGAFLTDDPPAPITEKKEAPPDGKKADPGPGTGAGVVAQPAAAAAAAPKPDAAKTAADAGKAADDPGKVKEGAAAEDDDEPGYPKNKEDWDRRKAKQKGREDKLKVEITTRETKLSDLERQLAAATAKPADDTATKAEIERRDALIKSLTDRIAVLDVTKDPRFEKYFEGKVSAQNKMASSILGDEKGAELTKILALPPGDHRTERMEAFMGELTPMQSVRLGGVLNSLDAIEQERAAEIEKAGKHRETLIAEHEARQKTFVESRQKGFDSALSALQDADPKKGNPLFQKREGDEKWNSALTSRVETAKKLLFGGNIAPDQAAKAALFASSFPYLVESYAADMTAKDATITKLEAQVKALTAAQPGGGGTGEKPAGGEVKPKSSIKADMNPYEVAEAFAKDLNAAANQ